MKKYILLTISLTLLLTACQKTTQAPEKETWTQLLWNGQNYKIESVQNNIKSKEPQTQWHADIDYDNKDEKIVLNNKKLIVYKNNEVIWQTDNEWEIENVLIEDLNWDGEIEINFSLWKKRGRYRKLGQFLESGERVNCFYIFKWRDGEIKPIWLSSPLDKSILKALSVDLNNDNKNELIVLEEGNENYAEYASIWSWNGWGFSNNFRSDKGEFKDFYADKENNTIFIKK